MGNPKPQFGHLTSVAIFIKGNKDANNGINDND
jgi:hypothetical protein